MIHVTRTASSDRGRHAYRRGLRAFYSPRSMAMSSIALLVAICLAGLATGGTYARWNKSQDANTKASSVIVSGTPQLSITTALAMPTTPMYPGLTIYGSAVLQNTSTSTSPLALSIRTTGLTVATSNAMSQALTIGLATASSAANCSAGTVSSPWVTSTFASPATATIGPAFLSGSSRILCVSATLSSTGTSAAAKGQATSNFTVVIDGIQS